MQYMFSFNMWMKTMQLCTKFGCYKSHVGNSPGRQGDRNSIRNCKKLYKASCKHLKLFISKSPVT